MIKYIKKDNILGKYILLGNITYWDYDIFWSFNILGI